jgi:hypothetical protein
MLLIVLCTLGFFMEFGTGTTLIDTFPPSRPIQMYFPPAEGETFVSYSSYANEHVHGAWRCDLLTWRAHTAPIPARQDTSLRCKEIQ